MGAYIDLVVANSPEQVKQAWRSGLKGLDASLAHKSGQSLAAAINQILNGNDPAARDFFLQVKELTITGYYTSEIGLLKELDYKGNQVMAMFPGCEK